AHLYQTRVGAGRSFAERGSPGDGEDRAQVSKGHAADIRRSVLARTPRGGGIAGHTQPYATGHGAGCPEDRSTGRRLAVLAGGSQGLAPVLARHHTALACHVYALAAALGADMEHSRPRNGSCATGGTG